MKKPKPITSKIRKRHPRKKRPNPARDHLKYLSNSPVFADPVFLHHLCGALMRLIEITFPESVMPPAKFEFPSPPFTAPEKVDAEFVPPMSVYPGEPPKGYIVCPQCNGFDDYCADVSLCETCRGKGSIPAPLPSDTPKA